MEKYLPKSNRTSAFQKNIELDGLLSELNGSLALAGANVLKNIEGEPDYPLIFVMGPHRSGTTLITQWLATTGIVAYPTNLLSRFYGAPLIGAQIQMLLTDPKFNFRNEILDFNSPIDFSSENGKTTGALAPNEFWYFWRRFLPFGELDWLSDTELFQSSDYEGLVTELTSLTRVFQKPFALKAMILNYNIPFLDEIFKKALFIQIKRDPISNVASILDARRKQLGSEAQWYSFKIPEYEELKELEPKMQAAGQLHYINKAVDKGMSSVAESKKLVVYYEDFCKNPEKYFDKIKEKLNMDKEKNEYSGVKKFNVTRDSKKYEHDAISDAVKSWAECDET